MKTSSSRGWSRLFLGAFAVLTGVVWSPLGYGSYGPAGRVFGVPSWAAVALIAAAVLFALEWVYLFNSRLALSDRELSGVLSALRPSPPPTAPAGKE